MKKQLLLITLLLTTFFSFGQVPTSERDALIALYNSTDGANWTNNTNWNTANPVSSWFGITVENISGQDHVTSIDFGYSSNNLNGTLSSEIGVLSELKIMVISMNSLLTGTLPVEIGNATNLIQFEIVHCNISGNIPMEFSSLINLEHLYLENNLLSGTIPNVFNSMNLKSLSLSNNNFSGDLILTNTNSTFYYIGIDNNQFGSFDFRNGHNTNIPNSGYVKIQDNSNLTCVFVDDATYSASNWTNIDATATFLETQVECDALFTNIPDDNFEQALIDLGLDNIIDDKVRTSNINIITSLNVDGKSITDLTGIEDFVGLTELICWNNTITSLDVTNNINLINLYTAGNPIGSLNVSQNTVLEVLNCSYNQLSTLDISNNPNLKQLGCSNNNLLSLDLTQNSDLFYLVLSNNSLTSINVNNLNLLQHLMFENNQISTIDLSNNLALTGFYCKNNLLTEIDISQNQNVYRFDCSGNDLISLNVKNTNNINFTSFNAINNPNLTCVFVDDATYSATNWTQIDSTATFLETQAECDVLDVTDETFKQSVKLYPNPTSGILYFEIDENITIKKIVIVNTLGQKIIENRDINNIDISNFPNGIYYINLENIKGNKTSYKIIKK